MFSISVFKLIGKYLNFRFKVSDLFLIEINPSVVLRNVMVEFSNLFWYFVEVTLSVLLFFDGLFKVFVTLLKFLRFSLNVINSI